MPVNIDWRLYKNILPGNPGTSLHSFLGNLIISDTCHMAVPEDSLGERAEQTDTNCNLKDVVVVFILLKQSDSAHSQYRV